MFLLAIFNRLKSFRWYFLVFAINWIYWKMELLQHVNMKRNNKCYWYVKSFQLTIYWQVFVLYFNPTIFHNLLYVSFDFGSISQTEIIIGSDFFQTWKLSIPKAIPVPGYSFLFW